MVISGLQKKIADRFMRMTIYWHIKKTYFNIGVTPTVEQVMQDINKDALNTMLSQGYTEDDIRQMIDAVIRRRKCKG